MTGLPFLPAVSNRSSPEVTTGIVSRVPAGASGRRSIQSIQHHTQAFGCLSQRCFQICQSSDPVRIQRYFHRNPLRCPDCALIPEVSGSGSFNAAIHPGVVYIHALRDRKKCFQEHVLQTEGEGTGFPESVLLSQCVHFLLQTLYIHSCPDSEFPPVFCLIPVAGFCVLHRACGILRHCPADDLRLDSFHRGFQTALCCLRLSLKCEIKRDGCAGAGDSGSLQRTTQRSVECICLLRGIIGNGKAVQFQTQQAICLIRNIPQIPERFHLPVQSQLC